ncbi:MAG TPA: prolyl oligopeptidase family serine peptidase [Caulobacter sp.]|nr:prolyl oligopeptidase family serine peptidase [Caulobacter sp.]
MITRRRLVALAAAGPVAFAGVPALAAEVASGAAPPTLEDLTREAVVLDAALSPTGDRIALLREQREGDRRLSYVLLAKVADMRAPPIQAVIGDYDVHRVQWASNDRLLVWFSFDKTADGRKTGIRAGARLYERSVHRLMAIGADGGNPVVLLGQDRSAQSYIWNVSHVVDPMVGDDDHILMQVWDPDLYANTLQKVNIHTGKGELHERGSERTRFWYTQNGVAVLRVDQSELGRYTRLSARPPGARDWQFVRKIRSNDFSQFDDFEAVGATDEAGVLLVATMAPGDDARTIRRFDIRTLALGEVVASHAGRDMEGVFFDKGLNPVAAAYTENRTQYEFLDAALAPHYRAVQNALGADANVLLHDIDAGRRRFIVHASGPRESGAFYLYDRETRSLDLLGRQKPWLPAERLAPMEVLTVRSRDGVELAAYLTRPLATGPRPMVVMPHGGPHARDSFAFDLFAQAFASKGWLVLQPNFRGSSGYGRLFAEAGHRRWADRMQEDVEDCVAHVVASGAVAPGRIAICGASYGGYAALMGGIRKPDLYRRIVSIAGVTDLPDLLSYEREDGADSPSYLYFVKTVGDPATDREALKRGSPNERAAELAAPVLLIHGDVDGVVPIRQSRAMAASLKRENRPARLIELRNAGHGGWEPDVLSQILLETTAFIDEGFSG